MIWNWFSDSHGRQAKTFVTTFWQLLQHFKPIPNYPVYSILTVPCKNINIFWLFSFFFLCLGKMRHTANQNACNALDIHVLPLAENVWETKPMVMDLNLFDSFLLTVFEWTSSISLCCTVVNANPSSTHLPCNVWGSLKLDREG
jgi:hypothetical protein